MANSVDTKTYPFEAEHFLGRQPWDRVAQSLGIQRIKRSGVVGAATRKIGGLFPLDMLLEKAWDTEGPVYTRAVAEHGRVFDLLAAWIENVLRYCPGPMCKEMHKEIRLFGAKEIKTVKSAVGAERKVIQSIVEIFLNHKNISERDLFLLACVQDSRRCPPWIWFPGISLIQSLEGQDQERGLGKFIREMQKHGKSVISRVVLDLFKNNIDGGLYDSLRETIRDLGVERRSSENQRGEGSSGKDRRRKDSRGSLRHKVLTRSHNTGAPVQSSTNQSAESKV